MRLTALLLICACTRAASYMLTGKVHRARVTSSSAIMNMNDAPVTRRELALAAAAIIAANPLQSAFADDAVESAPAAVIGKLSNVKEERLAQIKAQDGDKKAAKKAKIAASEAKYNAIIDERKAAEFAAAAERKAAREAYDAKLLAEAEERDLYLKTKGNRL